MKKIDFHFHDGQRVRIFLDEDARIYFLAPDLAKILGIRMIKLAKQADAGHISAQAKIALISASKLRLYIAHSKRMLLMKSMKN